MHLRKMCLGCVVLQRCSSRAVGEVACCMLFRSSHIVRRSHPAVKTDTNIHVHPPSRWETREGGCRRLKTHHGLAVACVQHTHTCMQHTSGGKERNGNERMCGFVLCSSSNRSDLNLMDITYVPTEGAASVLKMTWFTSCIPLCSRLLCFPPLSACFFCPPPQQSLIDISSKVLKEPCEPPV